MPSATLGGLGEVTSSGRINTHPLVLTTTCSPHTDIFCGVGVKSIRAPTRPTRFGRKTHMNQAAKATQWEKKIKAFHGPSTEYLLCDTHTHPLNRRSYQPGLFPLRGVLLFSSISDAHTAVVEFIDYFILVSNLQISVLQKVVNCWLLVKKRSCKCYRANRAEKSSDFGTLHQMGEMQWDQLWNEGYLGGTWRCFIYKDGTWRPIKRN